MTLAALRFRKGARFIYEYDLNIPWRHEVRIEDRLSLEVRKTYPLCTGGGGACPPEDCGGPTSFMARRDDRFSFDALEDLDTVVEVIQQVALKDGSEPLALDQETRWRLQDALERAKAREEAQGRPFLIPISQNLTWRIASASAARFGTRGFVRRFMPPGYCLSASPSPDTPEILMLSKKTQKTPAGDLDLARRRMKEMLE